MNIQDSIDASCPQCDSPEFSFLGGLGNLTWLRCRCCDWDFNVETVKFENHLENQLMDIHETH